MQQFPLLSEAGDTNRCWPLADTRPEDVFLAWLAWLPAGADIRTAAKAEIDRLDRVGCLSMDLARLKELLLHCTLPVPVTRRSRHRHRH